MADFDAAALAAAADSATVKALTGDAGTDQYAPQGVTGWSGLREVEKKHPDWAEAYLEPGLLCGTAGSEAK